MTAAVDSAADHMAELESVDPSVVRYEVPMFRQGTRSVYGWRVGLFVVRRSVEGEVGVAVDGPNLRGGVVVDYLAAGAAVADSASMRFVGELAWEMAWYMADELSRHLVVDESGFEACARAWPGLRHVWAQSVVVGNGQAPVPWHHTAEYALSAPTLQACPVDDQEAA